MKLRESYQLLNVTPASEWCEVKKSFRELVKKYHPDVNPDSRLYDIRFRRIVKAFKTLENHYKYCEGQRRLRELRSRKNKVYPTAGSFPETKPAFAKPLTKTTGYPSLSMQSAASSHGSRTSFGSRIQELLFGLEKKFFLLDFKKDIYIDRTIAARGNVIRVRKGSDRFQVRVPAGPWTRMFLRVPNKGDAGIFSKRRGDMLLNIQVQDPENTETDVPVYFYKIRVSRADIMAGKSIRLKTPEGPLKFVLPDHAKDGQEFIVNSKRAQKDKPKATHIIKVKLV